MERSPIARTSTVGIAKRPASRPTKRTSSDQAVAPKRAEDRAENSPRLRVDSATATRCRNRGGAGSHDLHAANAYGRAAQDAEFPTAVAKDGRCPRAP